MFHFIQLDKIINTAIAAALVLIISQQGTADETIWGVTDNQFLVSWDSSNPGDFTFGTAISGLQTNEQILGIDFRPANNELYAIGSSNRLYTIDISGVATQVGPAFGTGLDGSMTSIQPSTAAESTPTPTTTMS